IERAVWIALRPRADGQVSVHSLDFGETATFALEPLERGGPEWSEYLKATAWALAQAGHSLTGWEGVMASDVPIGAGLSSSAALELATARAFAAVSGMVWDAGAMARLAQLAENRWVGVNCGIMDQMISAAGEEGHAVLIDCRSLKTRPVPLPRGTVVVILDTATRRGLVDSAYNQRRRQCEAAAAFFGVPALRDVASEAFEAAAGGLDEETARRARHVVTENARTLVAAEAMRAGNAAALGELMNASHASLRDDFEVSSPALDAVVEIARARPGCYGARMTGAGFGGCAVALVDRPRSAAFVRDVAAEYERRTGLVPQIYVTGASAGAEVRQQNGFTQRDQRNQRTSSGSSGPSA
ncbi:MAG TPA: galactokinase, partial [Longimicrobium sp.]|nr:galactokinase [Longimicrobium sp.]